MASQPVPTFVYHASLSVEHLPHLSFLDFFHPADSHTENLLA